MAKFATKDIISQIIVKIPQQSPFRFIDNILELSEDGCIGEYTFKKDEYFYKGHFPNNPITPGVILTETMAQTGVIPVSFYREFLKKNMIETLPNFLLGETNIEFHKPVFPGECVVIKSKILYSKFRKVKAEVIMENTNKETVSIGTLAGFIIQNREKK